MIKITSNLSSVIDRLEHYPAHFEKVVAEVMRPESWLNEARSVAAECLGIIAEGDEILWVPDFVNTVMASALGERGFALAMQPVHRYGDKERAPAALIESAQDVMRGGQELFGRDVALIEADILDWVATPYEEGGKDRDKRDATKTDEEIADLISYIMLDPEPTPNMEGARARLFPHIAAFIGRKQTNSRIPPELVDKWLRAVLDAWRKMVMRELTKRIRAALKAKKFP